ncbi:MAG: bifunctional serine/threonine-protein kinase/formylglycine-generating enzyme family protein [Candidatus Cloacimonetes bacterium]|nr:bifunctional serine/threonine-protein kinase/formylglycine-generating enzyme family protein [Candidatus Cloacimonadota bacterium]
MFINIGARLNNFHVIEKIGEGGMGEVYLAEDESLGRKVALKVLNPALTADSQFVERFKQEARVQASMNHTNIVQLYYFFIHEDKYIMVLEYADGITLKELIRQTGPIPEERTIKIFNQICEALQYAHNKNIVHRDIKPSNIMIDSEDRVKIMDFGIAKIMGDMGLTRTGAKVGTLYYMSPEQVMARKDIDQRTDIYSLGITLFEMLSGKMPFNTDTDSDFVVMNHIVNSNLPDPRQQYPYISDKIIFVLHKMTEKDRNNRFGSISEIQAAQAKTDKKTEVHKSIDKMTEIPEEKVFEESIPPSIMKNQQIDKSTEEKKKNISKPNNKKVLIFVSLVLLVIASFFIWNKFASGRNPMIYIEGGTFNMGSNDRNTDEKPIHSVTLSSFYIGKYEVTQRVWQEVMGDNPSIYKGDNRPVENITWYEAVEFCNKLSKKEGLRIAYTINGYDVSCNWSANGYRLPTEAEWEYAASGGNKSNGYTYSGSNNIGDVAWYKSNSDNQSHDVGTKAANELGIYDMSGNVWEWCWDWYNSSYYSSSPSSNPRGPYYGSRRVFRGGSWHLYDGNCCVAFRNYSSPGDSYSSMGLRLVRTYK